MYLKFVYLFKKIAPRLFFKSRPPENKPNLIGIQLMSIVMTNDYDNCFDARKNLKKYNDNNRLVMFFHLKLSLLCICMYMYMDRITQKITKKRININTQP